MKNSKHFVGDAFAFYKKVCSKKQDAGLIARLLAMDPQIALVFAAYDQNFLTNSLEILNAHGYIDPEKADLKELYDYDSATLQQLKTLLTTSDTGRIIKCQNCTINDVNTYDHLVPQGDFSEFIVHPRNLLCCCGDCNSRKSSRWRNAAGQRTTLNLYLDNLPAIQYLFVTADIGNLAVETTYYLDNRNGIDAGLFSLIQNHYTRLNLFKRFSDGTDTVISSLKNILEPLRDFHDLAESKQIILQSIQKDQIAFGKNYWQSVLKLELLESDDFMIDYE
jgi:hypothetical protein